MTRAEVKAWLRERRPEPPADLGAKLERCVDEAPAATFDGASLAEVVGALGTWLLAAVVERRRPADEAPGAPPTGPRSTSGTTALDLLAADAFVTYAFEAVSEEGTDVTGLANTLLTRVRA